MPNFTFEEPDPARYPCLYLAIAACEAGQGATTALNAANEIAVAAFLAGQIAFTAISQVNEATLSHFSQQTAVTLEDILAVDQEARHYAQQQLRNFMQ